MQTIGFGGLSQVLHFVIQFRQEDQQTNRKVTAKMCVAVEGQ